MSQNVLAVDLDATLAKKQEPFNPYTVGAPVQPILDYVKDELAKGRKVVCFTARAASKDPKMHKAVRDWLDKHGLEKLEITNEKKPSMSEFLDDKAVGIVPNKGTVNDEHPVLEKAASNTPASARPSQFLRTLQQRNPSVAKIQPTPALPVTAASKVTAGNLNPVSGAAVTPREVLGGSYPVGMFNDVLAKAQKYQAANPTLPFYNNVSDHRMGMPVPVRNVLWSDHTRGAMAPGASFAATLPPMYAPENNSVWMNPDLLRANLGGRLPFGKSTPQYAATLRHEMTHATQDHGPLDVVDLDKPKSDWPHTAEGKDGTVDLAYNSDNPGYDSYLSSPAEIMARLPALNQAWVQRGGEFPTTPAEARSIIDHYGFGQASPNDNSFEEFERLPPDVQALDEQLRNMPAPLREAVLEQMTKLLPGVVDAGQVDTVKAAAEVLTSLSDADLAEYMETVDRLHLQEKIAVSYVRRTKLVEQHSDHCPHCDHEFSEKGYPRPDPDDEDPMTADSICPHCRGRIEQQELSDQEIDNAIEWLRPGMRKHRESLRARRERQSKQAAVNLMHWNSPETDPFAGELEKMAKSYPDKLKRLWLRQGKCPECGGMPQNDKETQMGNAACRKCGHQWDLNEAKEAVSKFRRPENYEVFEERKNRDLTLWHGANDWECADTWLWAVHRRDSSPDIDGDELVWCELQYPGLPHPGKTDVITSEQDKQLNAAAKKIRQLWIEAARQQAVDSGMEASDYGIRELESALQSKTMEPYAASSGRMRTKREEVSKQASAAPRTGPLAIADALKNLNLDELEKQARADIATGKVTKREKGVRMLQAISGLRRNEMQPHELMITKVPVLPPAFRPFSLMGSTYIPGNANELYADLFKHRDIHKQTVKELGEAGGSLTRRNLLNAVRALYGYGDPVSPKLVERRTKGFLQEITGGSPKTSFMQRKMISKPLDSIGRGVITVDPDLGMNQISLPRDMAWTLYGSFVQRRLAQQGFSPFDAVKAVKDRTRDAELALQAEMQEGSGRPVIYSRAPSWHKFNTIGGWARMHDGDNIAINPYVTSGLNADFDGDQCVNQLLACIPDSALPLWRMSYHNIDSHEIRFPQGSSIPTVRDGKLYIFDMEDFPHGDLQRTKEGAKGRIDFHEVPHPVQVLAYDENTSQLKWANVAFWSKHYQREIEIVDTHNGYQLITDDDPRAVYGTEAGRLSMQRFTPSHAVSAKVLIPRARRVPALQTTVTTVAGEKGTGNAHGLRMRDVVALNEVTGWIIGALCGDGWVIKSKSGVQGFALSDNDGHNVDKLRSSLSAIMAEGEVSTDWSVSSVATDPGRYGSTTSYRFTGVNVGKWLRSLIGGERDEATAGSANKHLPPFYLSTPEEFRSGLLCGLLDTDGSISISNGKSKPQLMASFSSTSIRLCVEVKLLAASLGVFGRITPSETPLGKPCWMVSFSNQDIQRWGAPHMCHLDKLAALKTAPKIEDSPVTAKYDIVPVASELSDALAKAIGCPKITKAERSASDSATLRQRMDTQKLYMSFAQARNPRHEKFGAVSRQTAAAAILRVGRNVVAAMPGGDEWLRAVDNTDVTWERITGVQKTGIKEDGYDLTVPGYETFMSVDGVILSNTLNVNVPIMDDSVQEAKEKLMPDKMIFSIRNQDQVMNGPKHEAVLGLFANSIAPSKQLHRFGSKQEALAAAKRGDVGLSDEIEYPDD